MLGASEFEPALVHYRDPIAGLFETGVWVSWTLPFF
jgi:hypothetical protein